MSEFICCYIYLAKTTFPETPTLLLRHKLQLANPSESIISMNFLLFCKVIRVEYAYNRIQVRPVYNKQR